MSYEYAVVPAPRKGIKAKGVKTAEDRFAHALQSIMNEYGADGWEYVRTDTLPSEERTGFTGRTTVYQNMMVFRKEVVNAAAFHAPAPVAASPAAETPIAPTPVAPMPVAAPPPAPEVAPTAPPAAPMPKPDQMMRVDAPPMHGRTEPTFKSE